MSGEGRSASFGGRLRSWRISRNFVLLVVKLRSDK